MKKTALTFLLCLLLAGQALAQTFYTTRSLSLELPIKRSIAYNENLFYVMGDTLMLCCYLPYDSCFRFYDLQSGKLIKNQIVNIRGLTQTAESLLHSDTLYLDYANVGITQLSLKATKQGYELFTLSGSATFNTELELLAQVPSSEYMQAVEVKPGVFEMKSPALALSKAKHTYFPLQQSLENNKGQHPCQLASQEEMFSINKKGPTKLKPSYGNWSANEHAKSKICTAGYASYISEGRTQLKGPIDSVYTQYFNPCFGNFFIQLDAKGEKAYVSRDLCAGIEVFDLQSNTFLSRFGKEGKFMPAKKTFFHFATIDEFAENKMKSLLETGLYHGLAIDEINDRVYRLYQVPGVDSCRSTQTLDAKPKNKKKSLNFRIEKNERFYAQEQMIHSRQTCLQIYQLSTGELLEDKVLEGVYSGVIGQASSKGFWMRYHSQPVKESFTDKLELMEFRYK